MTTKDNDKGLSQPKPGQPKPDMPKKSGGQSTQDPMAPPTEPSPAPNPESAPGGDKVG